MWFGLTVLFGLVTKEGLWNAKFRSMDTGEIFTAGYGTIFQYLLNRFPVFVFLVILCSVMCFSLALFFSYHLYLVKLGFTTNEKIKKSCLEDEYELGIQKRVRAIGKIPNIEDPVDKQRYVDLKEDISALKEKLKTVKAVSYSEGFLKNLLKIVRA